MVHVLSFDFGTGGVRAGIYDLAKTSMIAVAEATYDTDYPHPGWAEQDPRQWSAALRKAGRAAIKSAGVTRIDAVCAATTASTVVVCKSDGTPTRPALLWMDCRAENESRQTARIDNPVMRFCGGSDAVEWLIPKAMWVKKNQIEIWNDAEVVCEALDYVNFELTGRWVASRMNAACKWNYDSQAGQFVPEVYEALGILDLLDRLPQEVVPVGVGIGKMSAQMASDLGLDNRPLVAQGGIDAHIGMLGADVVSPGAMLFIGGTSVVQLTQLEKEQDVSGFWGPYPNALSDGEWLVECGQVSAGSILNWLAHSIFGLDDKGHADLIEEVAATPSRANGLLALDFWMGNRTPLRDGALRGTITGLTLGHDRADLYASCINAIALGSANVLRVLEEHGVAMDRVVMAGGILKNAAWMQATVDAIGRPVLVAEQDNLSLTGASVCAVTALGAFDSLKLAAQHCVSPTRQITPNLERHHWYEKSLSLYCEATDALTPVMHHLAKVQSGQST